ncbi:alcohol dehydrogenase-like [Clavelina lepadiformis]|uniref:alcohol dehydrogenase-like n=1 Tax=Clavelina lepadiformis TaxID=159417 RepID=UPI004041BC06
MMKRAQILKPCESLAIDTVAVPVAPPKGLVVKTAFGGICHSDLHQWENEIRQGSEGVLRYTDNPFYKLPVVPGHEISGVVHSMGSESETGDAKLEIGDEVVIYPWIGCANCNYCNFGDNNLCLSKHLWLGNVRPGGYASFVVIPERKFAIKIPKSIPLDVACMLSCSCLTTYNAVIKTKLTIEKATARNGKANVLIIGAGGLGLWSIQMAKHILPKSTTITVADINEEKLQIARDHGCHLTLCWPSSLTDNEAIAQAMKIGGYDAIIDFVNTSKTSNRAFRCLGMEGKLVMVGLFGGQANYSLPGMIFGAKTVQGVIVGTLQTMKDMINLVAKEKLIPPPMKYFQLEEITDALNLIKDGKLNGRGIINFSSSGSHHL